MCQLILENGWTYYLKFNVTDTHNNTTILLVNLENPVQLIIKLRQSVYFNLDISFVTLCRLDLASYWVIQLPNLKSF